MEDGPEQAQEEQVACEGQAVTADLRPRRLPVNQAEGKDPRGCLIEIQVADAQQLSHRLQRCQARAPQGEGFTRFRVEQATGQYLTEHPERLRIVPHDARWSI